MKNLLRPFSILVLTIQKRVNGKKNGYLLFNNKAKNTVRVPVKW